MDYLKNLSGSLSPYVKEAAKIVIWFFLIASLIIFSLHAVLSIAHPYPLDYGEAPLINQAMQLANGENIYRSNIDNPPFTITNYPPLYVISLLPFINSGANMFQIGRVISFLATIGSAVFLGLLTHHFFKNRLAAFTTAALFLSFPYVVEWSVRARIDCLALAFASAALFILARWPKSRWALFGGGVLLVAAAYTRQSYALAAPLGAFAWLWTQDKRRAIQLAVLVGGLGGLLFLLVNYLTNDGFYYNIITANVNEFGWDRLRHNLLGLWENAAIILVLSLIFLVISWKYIKGWSLMAFFLVGSFLSALTIGKIGSNVNYFLELTAALSLVGGTLITQSQKHNWRFALIILLTSFQIGLLMDSTMGNQVDWILASRRSDFTALQRLEQVVQDLEGPIPADEYMGMLTLNDRSIYIQPFEVSQMAKDGKWDQEPFLADIANHKFEGILIHHFGSWPVHKERWTPEMLSTIETYYRPIKTLAGTVLFTPQKETAISQVSTLMENKSFDPAQIVFGDIQTIANPSNWSQADIAINQNNPQHLVSIATQTTQKDCRLPNCRVEVKMYLTMDGGMNWTQLQPFAGVKNILYNGQVEFDHMDNVYAFGTRNTMLTINKTNLDQEYIMDRTNAEDITSAQVVAKTWFRVHPDTGQVFVTLDAQELDMLFTTPSLIRSTEYKGRWTTTSRADLRVSVDDFFSGRATWPDDIQILFGEDDRVSLVWTWDWEPWTWPRTVWMANSTNGGDSFGEPTPILETWGPIKATSSNGKFAIAYRAGSEDSQKLAVATSSDNGMKWQTSVASGDLPLYFDPDHGTGMSMAPNGVIDLVFYAHDSSSQDCLLDIRSWQETVQSGWVDPCTYNVYYSFSQDGGLTFSNPAKLNDRSVVGEAFALFEGRSTIGSHLEIASTNDYAYPIWIGSPSSGKTQLYTIQITR